MIDSLLDKPFSWRFLTDPVLLLYAGLGALVWLTSNSLLATNWTLQTSLSQLNQPITWLAILLYPVLEEIVFRCGLQGYLLNKPWGSKGYSFISLANLITAIIFSSLHILLQPQALASYWVIFPAIAFGHLRDRHQHIGASILLHSYYNTGFIIFMADTV